MEQVKNPDAEFLAFAQEFSKNYKIFSAGEGSVYHSANSNYRIDYLEKFPKEIRTDVRVAVQSGVIEVDKSKVIASENYNQEYIFFLIVWCWFRQRVQRADLVADSLALKFVSENFPEISKKKILKGLIQTCAHAPTGHNKERINNLMLKITKPK